MVSREVHRKVTRDFPVTLGKELKEKERKEKKT
jgi:hypothetical protein